jgi:hypothetical protein
MLQITVHYTSHYVLIIEYNVYSLYIMGITLA